MKPKRTNRWMLGPVTLAWLLAASALPAHAQDSIELRSSTVAGGGGRSESGGYVLEGTAGQPVAGSVSGGGYELESGFWAVLAPPRVRAFAAWAGGMLVLLLGIRAARRLRLGARMAS